MFTRVLFLGLLCCAFSSQAAILFSTNSTWRFMKGTNEASLPDTTSWRSNTFNDANFVNASSPFWYGDPRPGGTTLTDMQNGPYTCIFLRKTFVVTNVSQIGGLRLVYFIDDGFVAWLNGRHLYRENVNDPITRTTLAINQPIDPAPLTNTIVSPVAGLLEEGTNLITIQVFNTSTNSTDFGFDILLESVVSETVPPTLTAVAPLPGTLNALTQITVTFSEPVVGISADDLLINTQPASGVSGSEKTYTFTFAQPLYGNVSITWFPGHGITDEAFPPNPFNENGPGATWMYDLQDNVAPTVANLFPPPGVTLRSLGQVEVTFSEEVNGLDAADLLINNQPATSVTRAPGGPYVFQFPPPAVGTVTLQWAGSHGITDQAISPNAFAGGSWTYSYDPNASVGSLVINEVLASNQNGLLDEEGQAEDWIEIHNRGSNAVDLSGWSLSDDPDLPGLWVFGSRVLGPGQYIVVFASGKDRRNPASTNRFHTNFRLAGTGEFLGLFTPDSPRLLASAFEPEFPEQRNDHSYGRDASGNLRYFSTPTPGAPNGFSSVLGVCAPVHFNVDRGHFTTAFDLVLSTETPGAQIRYTTDGSEPTATSGLVYSSPLRVSSTALFRAAAFRVSFLPSTTKTHTYFFNQSASIRSLPVISIVTAISNLFGRTGILGMSGGSRAADGLYITNQCPPGSGIPCPTDYHNPSAHGIAWERPISAELIRPEDNSGFQVDCGIRVMGSDWQRPRSLPNHKFSYRFYMRGDYGPGRLEYPFFPDTHVESFDQVVIRAGFNDPSNPFIRDELCRRLSSDMGQIASHGTFAHVFTNGFYAGYFNPCERVHEEFMQSYFGGGAEWDVIGPSFALSSEGVGVVDGDRNDFNNMMTNVWGGSLRQITTTTAYNALARRVDLVNFVDYCLLNSYTAMGDWPANNWRAARERGNPNALWRFIVWDAEWANGFSGKPVTYDTFAQTGTGTLDAGLNSTVNSEIARLYQGLRAHPEFRLLWADRIHKHFFNGGALATHSVSNRVQAMRAELQGVFTIGDTVFLNWPRDRIAPLFAQFNTYGLYGLSNALYGTFASSNAPSFNQHGGRVVPGFVLTMTAPLGGTIYYTTNGSDPRVPFSGAVSNSAVAYSGPITLSQSVVIKARALLNGNWSAVAEAAFDVGRLGIPLRITEIMYNPIGGGPYEFIELQNVGTTTLDLSRMRLDGVTFTFLEGTSLAAGARLVLSSDTDPLAFASRYPGVVVAGRFSGNLNNAGERITLLDRQERIILTVDFNDDSGWPTAADGSGYSLEVIDPMGDPDDPVNWRASAQVNGSPGAAPAAPPASGVRLNEVMAENLASVPNGGTYPDWIELYNSGATAVNLQNWSLTDDANPRKFVFPPGSSIASNGYLIVWCDTNAAVPGLRAPFGLGRNGENIFLYNASTTRVDALTFGQQLTDSTVGLVGGAWQLNVPTPNAANVAAAVGTASALAINEWLANPAPGEDDWLELFNRTNLPVSLAGLYLGTTGAVHQITSLSFVAPGGFVQLFASEEIGLDHLEFKLPAAGGSIILYDRAAIEVTRVTYAAQTEGISQGRLPDGTGAITSFAGSASPGASNYINTYTGPSLNEVLARNRTGTNGAGQISDWVELFNPGATNFDLSGMSLSVDEFEPGQWTFPTNTSIGPNGYLLLWCDGSQNASTNAQPYLQVGQSLDGESGAIYLFSPSGQLVNSIEYGFQIEDLSIGRISGQWRLLASPSPGAANIGLAPLGANTGLRINEWQARPLGDDDWFEIYNTNALPVDLNGLHLTDDPSAVGQSKFRVAPLSFIGGRSWVKWVADENPGNGLNHVNFNLDGQGESLRIYSSSFALLDAVYFGGQPAGGSQGRLPDGSTTFASFPSSPTPGEANYIALENVIINEVLTHADPPLEDAVELYNPTDAQVNIGGWYLSNSRDNFKKYRIADDTTIAPRNFLVLYQYQFNDGSPNAFTLSSARGDEVWLSQADAVGNLNHQRTGVQFGPAENGVSFGRFRTRLGEEFVAMAQRTFGADNPGTLADFRLGTGLSNAYAKVGPVVIGEIMYHPPETNGVNNTQDEFIELHNAGGSAVGLFDPARPNNTWRLANGVDFAFPPSVTMPAGGRLLVVSFDPGANPAMLLAFRSRYGIATGVPVYGPYRGRLDNDGERLELYKPDPPEPGFVPYVLVEGVSYRDSAPWPSGGVDGGGLSLQRRDAAVYGNEPGNWVASTPTPGTNNGPGIVPPPVITASPQNQAMIAGTSGSLSVSASGSGPLSYQWRFNGIEIDDATNTVLLFPLVQLEHDGDYDVFVSNPGGSTFSAVAHLTVNAPPTILQPPTNIVGRAGSNITFSVTVTGPGPITYQWRFNGVNIPDATNQALLLTNVQLSHMGDYEVRVSNPTATISATASLVVLMQPTYLTQPLSRTILVGDNVTFDVSVVGSTPLGYRWRRDGIPFVQFPGTPSVTVSNVPLSFNGSRFTVVITNAANMNPGIISSNGWLFVLVDSDGDRMPDVWETAFGLNQTNAFDSTNDLDGDTMLNRDEYIAGTDPQDPLSYLKVNPAMGGGLATLQFVAMSNRTYAIEYNDALGSNPWSNLVDVAGRATNRIEVITDSAARPKRYYRLVIPPQQ